MDGLLVPGVHDGQDPVSAVNVAKVVGGDFVEDEEEVGFAAHDDEVVLLVCGEGVGRVDGVEEAVQALVVLGGVGISGGGDDTDADVAGEEMDQAGYHGVLGGERGAVVVERDVSVEGEELEGCAGPGSCCRVARGVREVGGIMCRNRNRSD